MALCKLTTCDNTTFHSSKPRHTTTNITQKENWISADVQARIEPPPITLIKAELEEERVSNIIKVKMQRNPEMYTS